MGCGASKDPKIDVADSHRPLENSNTSYKNPNRENINKNNENNNIKRDNQNRDEQNRNGFKKVELKSTPDTQNNESPKIPTRVPALDNKSKSKYVMKSENLQFNNYKK